MGELIIGDHTYGTPIRRGKGNNITIGKFCQIAENVRMDGGFQHNTKFISIIQLLLCNSWAILLGCCFGCHTSDYSLISICLSSNDDFIID